MRVINAKINLNNIIDTTYIGNVLVRGENKPITVNFVSLDVFPANCYLMYQRPGDAAPYIVALQRLEVPTGTSLTYVPTIHFCAKAGSVKIQIIACDIDPEQATEDDVVKLTEIAAVNVADSMSDPLDPEPLDSIFTTYLSQFESLKEQATEEAGKAREYAIEADNSRIASIAEQTSSEDGGVNIITITYKDGQTETFTVKNGSKGSTGEQGPQGMQGPTGNGISSITVYYAVTSTQTSPDASDITGASIPTLSSSDKYLWQKMVILYTSGSSETIIDLVAVYGDKGDKGDTGATGNGISSIAYRYAVTTTQVAPLPENVTSDSIPTMSNTDKYLWTKQTITYTSGSPTVTVYLLSIYGDKGDKGNPGEGVPTGGTTGQILKKKSDTNFDTEWADEQDISGKADKSAVEALEDKVGEIDWTEEAPPQDLSEQMEQLREDVEETVTQAVGNMQYDIIAPETIECLRAVAVPSSSSSEGLAGDISFDSSYFYICISDGVWKRTALTDF